MKYDVLGRRAGLCLRQAFTVVPLVALAFLASQAVVSFQALTPLIDIAPPGCVDSKPGPSAGWLLTSDRFTSSNCVWDEARTDLEASGQIARRANVDQREDGRIRIRLDMTVPTGSTVAKQVEQGRAAEDVQGFLGAIWGSVWAESAGISWSYPDLTLDQQAKRATITVTGSLSLRSGTLHVSPNGPTTLQISLPQQQITAVDSRWHVIQRGPYTLVADLRKEDTDGDLTLTFVRVNSVPPSTSDTEDALRLQWLTPGARRFAETAGRVLTAAARAMLAASGWCVLLLAATAEALGPLRHHTGIERLLRVAGGVVLVHMAVWISPWLIDDDIGRAVEQIAARSLGWISSGSAGFWGMLVLMASAALVVVPQGMAALFRDVSSTFPHRRRWPTRLLLAVAAAVSLWMSAQALSALARYQADIEGKSVNPMPMAYLLPLALTAVLATISLAAGAVALRAGWRIRLSPLLWASAFVPLLSVGAALHDKGGLLPLVIRWAGPLLIGALLVSATGRLTWWTATQSRPWHRWSVLLFPVGAALAVPWTWDGPFAGWMTLWELPFRLDAVLGLVLVVAVVQALRELGLTSVTGPRSLRPHRALGIVLTFTMAAGSFRLLAVPSPMAVIAAALVSWLLFPYGQIQRAAVVLGQTPRERNIAVNRTVRAGAVRRALPVLRKAARDKVSEGPRKYSAAHRHLKVLERASFDVASPPSAQTAAINVSTRERAFGGYTGEAPWPRAVGAAQAAAVIAVPWMVLSLASTAVSSRSEDSYPVFTILTTVTLIVVDWVGFGLLYGYFFPLLRGKTGLAKALWMYSVMLVPAITHVTTSGSPSHWGSWTDTLLYGLEALAFIMTLGLRVDATVLTAARLRPARLSDIHNLGSITAWWSSVALALATGVAAVVIAGLQPFLLNVFPQPPQVPPIPAPSTQSP